MRQKRRLPRIGKGRNWEDREKCVEGFTKRAIIPGMYIYYSKKLSLFPVRVVGLPAKGANHFAPRELLFFSRPTTLTGKRGSFLE